MKKFVVVGLIIAFIAIIQAQYRFHVPPDQPYEQLTYGCAGPMQGAQAMLPVTIINGSEGPIQVNDVVMGGMGSQSKNQIITINRTQQYIFEYGPAPRMMPESHMMIIQGTCQSATNRTNMITIPNPSGSYTILSDSTPQDDCGIIMVISLKQV